jgi:hypothetical protein
MGNTHDQVTIQIQMGMIVRIMFFFDSVVLEYIHVSVFDVDL